jgi:hypothetical protein
MTTAPQGSSRSRLLRDLYFNRTGLLFLITVILAIGMYVLSARTHGNARAFWLTLATGLLATAAYAVFSVLITTRQFDSFLRTTIEQTILETVQEQQRSYVPVAFYRPTDHPDAVFNRDLNKALANSERYIFQGVTARYMVARLAKLETFVEHVRIIVADPTKPESVITRAKHDVDNGEDGQSLAKERADLIDDIWMSIVGAYLIRRMSNRIEFCLLADPPVDRAEIFDKEIFLTRYSDPESKDFRFPSTCKFASDSLIYQMHVKDCARLFVSPYTVRFEIPRDNQPESLFKALHNAGLSLDETQYSRLKSAFLSFTSALPKEIKA